MAIGYRMGVYFTVFQEPPGEQVCDSCTVGKVTSGSGSVSVSFNLDLNIDDHFGLFSTDLSRLEQLKQSPLFGRFQKRLNIDNNVVILNIYTVWQYFKQGAQFSQEDMILQFSNELWRT